MNESPQEAETQRAGREHASKMVVFGRAGRLDAAEALRISLVDEVDAPEVLRTRAIELSWRDALQRGCELLLEQRANHPDSVEEPRAFVERREPNRVVQ